MDPPRDWGRHRTREGGTAKPQVDSSPAPIRAGDFPIPPASKFAKRGFTPWGGRRTWSPRLGDPNDAGCCPNTTWITTRWINTFLLDIYRAVDYLVWYLLLHDLVRSVNGLYVCRGLEGYSVGLREVCRGWTSISLQGSLVKKIKNRGLFSFYLCSVDPFTKRVVFPACLVKWRCCGHCSFYCENVVVFLEDNAAFWRIATTCMEQQQIKLLFWINYLRIYS